MQVTVERDPNAATAQPNTHGPDVDSAKGQRAVCTSIGLGWQVAELFHGDHAEQPSQDLSTEDAEESLPSIGNLEPKEREHLRLEQLLHGINTLASETGNAELRRLGEYVRAVIRGDEPDFKARELHVKLLKALTVADFRLGKAYNLGRALFEVSRESPQEGVEYGALLDSRLNEKRLTRLIAWSLDLKTVLPDHAGQAVADSLERWRSWASQKPWEAMELSDFTRRLRRQGERWRAILTGEKEARDLLTISTYIEAGEELVSDAAKVVLGFARRFWALTGLAAFLLAGGLVAIIFFGSSNAVIGGLVSIATALGISWKTTSSTLSKLSEKLSPSLWGAELDTAIAIAVTDPLVPETSVALPGADQPVPVKRAIDARTTRKTARQVWKRLDRATRAQAASGRRPLKRAAYRFAGLWRGGARAPFLPHDVYLSHVQSALEARLVSKGLEASESSRDELFAQFGPNDWEWIKTVVQGGLTMFEGRHSFGVDPCERQIDNRARIVLFSDWATGMPHAQALADRIREALEDPDAPRERHLIHLGDVYYCGEVDEYRRRFLRYWPTLDGVTAWNLNGNHDMYSGGHGYFELISGEGAAELNGDPNGSAFEHQKGTSFFRIFNDNWQVIGLDSAYVDKDLDERQLPSLEKWLGLSDGQGGGPSGRGQRTILLSHHQLGSSREPASIGTGILKKTAEARKKGLIHAWFWGHEHRAFVYEKYLGVSCPVCIGNGGVPELLSSVPTLTGAVQWVIDAFRRIQRLWKPQLWSRKPKVRFQQEQPRVDARNLEWEKLGFVVIDLTEDGATAVYCDEDGGEHPIDTFGS